MSRDLDVSRPPASRGDHRLLNLRQRAAPLSRLAVVVLVAGIARGASLLTTVLIARKVSPAAFGEFSVFFAVLVAISTATAFIDYAYVRHAVLEAHRAQQILGTALVLKGIAFAVLALTAYPAAWLLADRVLHKPQLTGAIAFAVVSGGALNIVALAASGYQAAEQFARFALFTSLPFLVALIGILCALGAHARLTLHLVYSIFVTTAFLLAFVSIGLTFRRIGGIPRYDPQSRRSLLSFGKWLVAGNWIDVIVQRLDVVLLARQATLGAVGQYGAALRVAGVGSLLTGSLPGILVPRASRTRGSEIELRRYRREAWSLAISLVGALGLLWLIVPFVVRHVYGAEFAEAIGIARILILALVFTALYNPMAQLFLAEDRPRKFAYLGLLRLVSTPILLLLLVSRYGARGAALAVLAAEVISFVFVMLAVRRAVLFSDRSAPGPMAGR